MICVHKVYTLIRDNYDVIGKPLEGRHLWFWLIKKQLGVKEIESYLHDS